MRSGLCEHHARSYWIDGPVSHPIWHWLCEWCGVTDTTLGIKYSQGAIRSGERKEEHTMASGQKAVYVPDRSAPMYFDAGLTTEEIKSALVSTGYTAVQNAEARISTDGQTIRFERVTGGSKGV